MTTQGDKMKRYEMEDNCAGECGCEVKEISDGDYILFSDVEQMKSDHEKEMAEKDIQIASMQKEIDGLKHKANQYDSIVEAVNPCDGGKYRADTIESIKILQERCAELENRISDEETMKEAQNNHVESLGVLIGNLEKSNVELVAMVGELRKALDFGCRILCTAPNGSDASLAFVQMQDALNENFDRSCLDREIEKAVKPWANAVKQYLDVFDNALDESTTTELRYLVAQFTKPTEVKP